MKGHFWMCFTIPTLSASLVVWSQSNPVLSNPIARTNVAHFSKLGICWNFTFLYDAILYFVRLYFYFYIVRVLYLGFGTKNTLRPGKYHGSASNTCFGQCKHPFPKISSKTSGFVATTTIGFLDIAASRWIFCFIL